MSSVQLFQPQTSKRDMHNARLQELLRRRDENDRVLEIISQIEDNLNKHKKTPKKRWRSFLR